MSSKSARRGSSISGVEVANISLHGFWINLKGEELFLSFEQFPWFRRATVSQITAVTLPSAGHLHWTELDVDLAVESIRKPSSYPLLFR